MKKIENVLEKLNILMKAKVLIAGYLIKGIGETAHTSFSGRTQIITEMYCDFEGFSLKFTQDEFLIRSTNTVYANILISDLPNITKEKLEEDSKQVFEELRSRYLQDELEAVRPSIIV